MKKKISCFGILLILSLFLISSNNNAHAISITPPTPDTYNEMSIQSTIYLKVWTTSITQKTIDSIQISGTTESYSTVSTIGIKLYLQYWNGDSWLDLAYAGDFTEPNSNYVYAAKDIGVTRGFYYRVKGVHYVDDEGTKEQVTSYTNHIFIE